MTKMLDQLRSARSVSVPIAALATPDAPQTVTEALKALEADHDEDDTMPAVEWDIVRGVRALNEAGRQVQRLLAGGEPSDDETKGQTVTLLDRLTQAPAHTVCFMHLGNRWLSDAITVQAIVNLRDAFKSDGRMLVLLGSEFTMPAELAGDVLMLDEPLPTGAELATVIVATSECADLKLDGEQIDRCVEALQGLPAFAAEQAVAMSLGESGVDVAALWERKRRQIEQTPGLNVHRGGDRFESIGGCSVVKDYLTRLLNGRGKPSALVWVDEIEKALAGAGGDTSGVSQDYLGTLLSYMEDHRCYGLIFLGPPGAAKSAVAKAAGNESGIPTVRLDLGGMKGSLVGESEARLRQALKVITAVSNDASLWIATCNSVGNLDAALLRRFPDLFFFDLPDREEKDAIWNIWRKKFELAGEEPNPRDEGWAGANIQKACEKAWRLECPLDEAARFIVPVAESAKKELETLRDQADGRFLSASYRGVYRKFGGPKPVADAKPKRHIVKKIGEG